MKHDAIRTRRKPSWADLARIGREHPAFAEQAITDLRDEALELSSPVKSCDWSLNRCVADAAQSWLDCAGEPGDQRQALDELDTLLADNAPEELREARHESVNDYGRWWL